MLDNTIEVQILCIGLLVLGSYFMGKLTRHLKIGETTGQMIGGLLVGPYFLSLAGILPAGHRFSTCYKQAFGTFHFFTFAFLGLVAFGIGEELHVDRLKAVGMKAVVICAIQGALTFALTTVVFLFLLDYEPLYALLIGSIGIATAPATTFAIMNKIALEGKLRDILANIVVLADIIEVLIFSVIMQLAWMSHRGAESRTAGAALLPAFRDIGLAIGIGIAIFLALKLIIREKGAVRADSPRPLRYTGFEFLSSIFQERPTPSIEVLLIIVGFIAVGVGIGMSLHLPFLIITVVAGFCIANFHSPVLFDSLKIANVMPMFHLLFFAIIGANIRLDTFRGETITFVLAYIATRGVGKLFGTWLGAVLTGQGTKLRRVLPLLMMPQAGVAAVEAYFVGVILGDKGSQIVQVILPALVVFEMSGVIISERVLTKWKSWAVGEEQVLRRPEKTSRIERLKGGALLAQVLCDETIKIPLFASDREGAVAELAGLLEKAGKIPPGTPLAEEVMEREKLAPTGLGNGVALPHGRSPEITSPVCALGIKAHGEGIDFGSADGTPADIIFLIVSPEASSSEHLQMLAAIALTARQEENREALRQAHDARDVLDILGRVTPA
jgi:mannitol/fructose-specific phosphotransferase system IIA component (Ntr-type)